MDCNNSNKNDMIPFNMTAPSFHDYPHHSDDSPPLLPSRLMEHHDDHNQQHLHLPIEGMILHDDNKNDTLMPVLDYSHTVYPSNREPSHGDDIALGQVSE